MPSLITHGAGGAGSSSQYQKLGPHRQAAAATAQQYQQQYLPQQDQYRAKEHPGHVSTLLLFCYMHQKLMSSVGPCPEGGRLLKILHIGSLHPEGYII